MKGDGLSRLLIIGGTGMLREATEYYIAKNHHVTVHGRDERRLNYFTETYPDKPISLVAQDYHEKDKFIAAIRDDRARHGEYDIVISWIHGSGEDALLSLIDMLAVQNPQTLFYHVKGSASYNPAVKPSPVAAQSPLAYREIILGFKIEKGAARWLHNSEISAGVVEAVDQGLERHVIGVTEPWDSRPGW